MRDQQIAPLLIAERPIWLRPRDIERANEAEDRASQHRRCAICITALSRYNTEALCGACRVKEREAQDARILALEAKALAAEPARPCRGCRRIFYPVPYVDGRPSQRGNCYECAP